MYIICTTYLLQFYHNDYETFIIPLPINYHDFFKENAND